MPLTVRPYGCAAETPQDYAPHDISIGDMDNCFVLDWCESNYAYPQYIASVAGCKLTECETIIDWLECAMRTNFRSARENFIDWAKETHGDEIVQDYKERFQE